MQRTPFQSRYLKFTKPALCPASRLLQSPHLSPLNILLLSLKLNWELWIVILLFLQCVNKRKRPLKFVLEFFVLFEYISLPGPVLFLQTVHLPLMQLGFVVPLQSFLSQLLNQAADLLLEGGVVALGGRVLKGLGFCSGRACSLEVVVSFHKYYYIL
jgi:hypothetical protein